MGEKYFPPLPPTQCCFMEFAIDQALFLQQQNIYNIEMGGIGSISAVLSCSVFPPREETDWWKSTMVNPRVQPSFRGGARAHFPNQRLVIEPMGERGVGKLSGDT